MFLFASHAPPPQKNGRKCYVSLSLAHDRLFDCAIGDVVFKLRDTVLSPEIRRDHCPLPRGSRHLDCWNTGAVNRDV